MPDAFFSAPKNKKRKRSDAPSDARNGSKKFSRKPNPRDAKKTNKPTPKKRADEELSDQTDDDAGNVDDMDLRADEEPGTSGDEDENETPAEKRLRLAKLYLESVKTGLGAS